MICRKGWMRQMKSDLSDLGIDGSALDGPAENVINIRFEPSEVTFFDPRIPFPSNHKLYRINRYQPIDWDDDLPRDRGPLRREDGRHRSEEERRRAAIEGTTYSPRHVILQNALHDHLCHAHGREAVHYEKSFVDLSLEQNGEKTYFEIKIAPTAKACIRDALGQVLEYGIYPATRRATKLVIVGDGVPTSDDCSYLKYLRETFGLPIFYQQWPQG